MSKIMPPLSSPIMSTWGDLASSFSYAHSVVLLGLAAIATILILLHRQRTLHKAQYRPIPNLPLPDDHVDHHAKLSEPAGFPFPPDSILLDDPLAPHATFLFVNSGILAVQAEKHSRRRSDPGPECPTSQHPWRPAMRDVEPDTEFTEGKQVHPLIRLNTIQHFKNTDLDNLWRRHTMEFVS